MGNQTGKSSTIPMATIPEGFKAYKRTPLFQADSIPNSLLSKHNTKAGSWGKIIVTKGSIEYLIYGPPERVYILTPENPGIIVERELHKVKPLTPDAEFQVEFYAENPELAQAPKNVPVNVIEQPPSSAAAVQQQIAMDTIPAKFKAYKKTPVFNAENVPNALLNKHNTKVGSWGKIHIIKGSLEYLIYGPPERVYILTPNNPGVIKEQEMHKVKLLSPDTEFQIEFWAENPEGAQPPKSVPVTFIDI